MSQSITLIDAGGNKAQYTVFDKDQRNSYYWSTDHGDHGVAPTFEEAQERARCVLKESMTANRRNSERHG
jgi:hypothetical protein